jgi:hypothetical protein
MRQRMMRRFVGGLGGTWQTEHPHAGRRADVDSAVDDRRRDELVAAAERVPPVRGLRRVSSSPTPGWSRSYAWSTAGLLFSTAHTIPLVDPDAEMDGVVPG